MNTEKGPYLSVGDCTVIQFPNWDAANRYARRWCQTVVWFRACEGGNWSWLSYSAERHDL